MTAFVAYPFQTFLSGTIVAAVSATSTVYTLATYPTNQFPTANRSCYVFNQGNNIVWLEFTSGSGTPAASVTGSMPIAAGVARVVGIGPETTKVAAIATSGPSTTSFTMGSGI